MARASRAYFSSSSLNRRYVLIAKNPKPTTRTYSTRSAPRPTPSRPATQVTSSGLITAYAAKARNTAMPILTYAPPRLVPWLRNRNSSRPTTPMMSRILMTVIVPPSNRRPAELTQLMTPPDGRVEHDVHPVEQRLPLGDGVVCVQDRHLFLGHPPALDVDHLHDLRCVAHPVGGDVQPVGDRAVERPQPV